MKVDAEVGIEVQLANCSTYCTARYTARYTARCAGRYLLESLLLDCEGVTSTVSPGREGEHVLGYAEYVVGAHVWCVRRWWLGRVRLNGEIVQ